MVENNFLYWERVLTRELQLLWNKSEHFLPCHGPEHHLRVWRAAKPFGLRHKADMDVLLACCLFHDVHAFNAAAPHGHEVESAKIAKRILRMVRFPAEKIPLVMRAIQDHRSGIKSGSLEGKIFKSFDKIDAFGPIGVYRIIAPFSIRKYGAEDIVRWALEEKHLEKKWNSIAFPELRRRFRSRYLYTQRYFERLRSSLAMRSGVSSRISERVMYSRG